MHALTTRSRSSLLYGTGAEARCGPTRLFAQVIELWTRCIKLLLTFDARIAVAACVSWLASVPTADVVLLSFHAYIAPSHHHLLVTNLQQ